MNAFAESSVKSPVPDEFRARDSVPRLAGWVLLVLFVLCLVPRTWMALRAETVCDDAFYYVSTAQALESGDQTRSLDYLGLNIYPYVLIAIHSLGLDWVAGGMAWSVLASSLVVLPLVGWVRRLFDDRVGVAAGFLYAIHPRLIETGIEPIREPTFWLLFTTALWLTLRACRSGKARWYVPAGVVAALAIHTRTEGWLLVLPLLAWSAARMREQRAKVAASLRDAKPMVRKTRIRLFRTHDANGSASRSDAATLWSTPLVGAAVWLAAIPAIAVLLNVALLGSEGEWRWSRTGVAGASASPGDLTSDGVARSSVLDPIAAKRVEVTPWFTRIERYVLTLGKTFGPGVLVMMIAAVVLRGRCFAKPETAVLVIMGAAVLAAVALRSAQTGAINGRYFLTILLVSAPLDALGFVLLARRLTLATEGARRVPALAPAAVLLVGSLLYGWAYALNSAHPGRQSQVRFARCLRPFVGPGETVVADARSTRLGYVAGGRLPVFIDFYFDYDRWLAPLRPAVIILSEQMIDPRDRPLAIGSAARLGFVPLDKSLQPKDLQDHLVLVRPQRVNAPNAQ